MSTTRPTTPANEIRPLAARNDSGEVIPLGGFCRITGVVSGTDILTIDKPNADTEADQFAAVALGPMAVDGYGNVSLDFPVYAKYDTGDGTPSIGNSWGVEDGSWELHSDKTGYTILGGALDGLVMVFPGGPSQELTVVTQVCDTISEGCVTKITVQYQSITLLYGSVVGAASCTDDPDDCCP